MNILKIRTNTVTNENYDEFGNYFRRGNPKISIGSTFRLEWYLYTGTQNANNSGVNVGDWVPDTTLSGYSAILTCDADWVHRVAGTMETNEIKAGETFPEQISVNISGAAGKNIASSGKMTLYNSKGMFQTILYLSREINGSSVVFSLGAGLHAEYSFSAGDSVTVSQEAYFEAVSIAEESDPGNGKFVFDVVVRSRKLQQLSDTMTSGSVKIQGLELLPFKADESGNYIQSPAYLLDSAILISTIGDPIGDAEISDTVKSEIGAIIDEKLKGFSPGGGGEGWSNQAADIKISDIGNHFEATNVEDALAELAESINSLSNDFSTTLSEIATGLAEI